MSWLRPRRSRIASTASAPSTTPARRSVCSGKTFDGATPRSPQSIAADHELDAIAVMVQFHPAFTYFGARTLRFEPDPPDPMTALVVASLPVRRLPSLIRHIATGKSLANVTGVEVWPGLDRLEISAKSPALHELDGELLGPIVEATITHRPEALWVAVPPRRRG